MTDENAKCRHYTATYINNGYADAGVHGIIQVRAVGSSCYLNMHVRLVTAKLTGHLPCTKTVEVVEIKHNFPHERERILDALLYTVPFEFILKEGSPLQIRSPFPTITFSEKVLRSLSDKIRTSIPVADGAVGIVTRSMAEAMHEYIRKSAINLEVI